MDDQRALLASLGRRLPSLTIIGRTAIGPAERGPSLAIKASGLRAVVLDDDGAGARQTTGWSYDG